MSRSWPGPALLSAVILISAAFGVASPITATDAADAPTTILPCRTMTWATAPTVLASDNPALSSYRRLVRAARPRYFDSLSRRRSSAR